MRFTTRLYERFFTVDFHARVWNLVQVLTRNCMVKWLKFLKFFFFFQINIMVTCNSGCVFCDFLAFAPIVQLWNCKAAKKHDRLPHKRVVSLKGVIRKKGTFYGTSSIYCFCIWIFLVFTVYIFSTTKTLRTPNLKI